MASEKGPVATEAPPFPSTAPQSSVAQAPISVEALALEAARATQSLKRQREATPTSPSSVLPPPPFNPVSSPPKAARIAGLPRRSPAPLTAAAALEDDRRREEEQYRLQVSGATENPAYKAQSALMSASALAMSRPEDAPQPSAPQPSVPQPSDPQPSDPQPDASSAPATMLPAAESDPRTDVSPNSTASMASLGAATGAPVTDSPAPMDIDTRSGQAGFGSQPPAQMEEKGPTSLSYPGMLSTSPNMPAPPARGMTMPMTPTQATPRSPNSKKHKCPYCETEFTRHHNLKSHLLTHSQEKPYVCQTCTMRFRRLHDLKRHSKLHTGEKPHICPKCDRKFARGDALARHSKGPGGCVGRRSSLGSFLGEDDGDGTGRMDGDDSVMSGVIYEGHAAETDMSEEDKRRLSGLPSIKAQHVHQGTNTSRLFPPNVDRGSASSNASHTPGTSISSLPLGAGNATSLYAQSGMTESPKPLSPGLHGHDAGGINRQRSPSLNTQLQQQFGRPQSDHHTSPAGFTAADAARYAASTAGAPGAASASQTATGNSSQQILSGAGLGHARTPSGPGQNGGSGDSSSNNIFATEQGVWAYIHNLEDQVRQLGDRIQAMEATARTQEERIASQGEIITSQEEKISSQGERLAQMGEVMALRSSLETKVEVPDTIDQVG